MDVSASLINTVYEFVENVTHSKDGATPDLAFLQRANLDQLLLLSHSLGGSVACNILTGMSSPEHVRASDQIQ